MEVEKIVEAWLKDHGYDGLFSSDGECGCVIGELAPCMEIKGDCCAGYQAPCDPMAGFDFVIQAEKPADTEPSKI